ncbi:MAG TPA: serine/threonine-protein kinase, partial [Gemmatimonadaceae bacterium]
MNEASRREQLARVADSDPELGMMVESLLAGDAIADEALPAPGFGLPSVSGVGSTDTFGLEGKTVGRFRVIERVAWGGMGVVYRAEDLRLGRNVALKFPLLDRDVSEIARVLSLREARAAGALDHPNVCPIYDVGESAQGPYLVMPLYSGETLKERITRVGPMPASEALDVLQQVAAGLACAHAAGIVHCDVKPGNIMLLPDGVVKILDFGLARAGSVDSAVSSGAIGTVAYMAPEQIRNEPVDARTDLWALGVTLYEMLCGSRPFVGEDASEIARAVVESNPTSLAARGVFLPSEVQDLVSALLAPERDARPQTASALIGAISTARSAMDRSVRRREMRRRYVVVGFAAAAIAIVASVLWLRPAPTLISAHKLAPFDAAVLADVQVTGPDSNDAPVFTSIVRREFEDSRAVRLMSDRDVRSALERMRRPGKTAVADSVARQIALRENARVVLSSRVLPLGSGYLVAVRLIDAESGNELTASTKRATNAEKLPETLSWASREVRRAIGESPRGANAPASRRKKPLTTTSLEVARLLWANTGTRSAAQKLADTRAALRLDTAFAYGWMSLGNMLQWTNYRSALVDTAFKTAYALRDGVTLMERAQISGMYWATLQRNRRSALAEANQAIALDSAMYGAVPLNMTVWLNDSRQFEETERFGRRIERWPTVGPSVASAVVAAQIALGKYAAAESTIARRRAARPKDQALDLELLIALSALRFDSAETLLTRAQPNRATGDWPALHRLR